MGMRTIDVHKKYVITHYNITFAPDLSNRVNPNLYRRPLNDVDILKVLTRDLYPSILRCRRSENQVEQYYFSVLLPFFAFHYVCD